MGCDRRLRSRSSWSLNLRSNWSFRIPCRRTIYSSRHFTTELVTTVVAVRQGSLTLAVDAVLGASSFDLLLLAFSDWAYREGSIYHALQSPQVFVVALTILMTGILLLGWLRREKHGIGNIGFESVLILILYFSGFSLLFFRT